MKPNEAEGLEAQNKHLLGLLSASRRRRAETRKLVLDWMNDLTEWVGWTDEPQSLELVEAMRDDMEREFDARTEEEDAEIGSLVDG